MSCMARFSDEEHATIQRVVDAIQTLPNGLRQAHVDELYAQLGDAVNESGIVGTSANPAPAGGIPDTAVLNLAPQISGWELIQVVVVSLPPNTTGTVRMGGVTVPVPAGVTVMGGLQLNLASSDARQLTVVNGPNVAVAGVAGLWLSGRQQPTQGAGAR